MTRATIWIACLAAAAATAAGCNDYGQKLDVDGSEVYYKNVSQEEAKKLGDHLKKTGYFTDKKKVSVQLNKEGETYQVRLVVVDNFKELEGYPVGYQRMAAQISSEVFNDKPVEVHLTDDKFKTVETMTLQPLGRIVKFDDSEVFYTDGVSKKQAEKLGEALKTAKYFTNDRHVTVQIGKQDDTYALGFVVVDDYKEKPGAVLRFRFLGALASRQVFEGQPVQVRLLSGRMKELEVLEPLPMKSRPDGAKQTPMN